MNRIVHFEIHAMDPLRAIKFYTNVFSWEITKWEWGDSEYWLVVTGPKEQAGINGGILRRNMGLELWSPSGFVCTIDVPSVDLYSELVKKNWWRITVPKMEVPGSWWLVYCNDTEWNVFGMMETTMNGMM